MVIAATLLGACATGDTALTAAAAPAPPPPPSEWKFERKTDRITGAPRATAFLQSSRSSTHTRRYKIPQPAFLRLSCFRNQPVVQFAFMVKDGSNRNASVSYRFDENPGHDAKVRFLEDYKTVVIEDKAAVARFADELAGAKTLFVRVDSLISRVGQSNAEFRVHGAPAAIEAAFADCPLPASPPRKPAGA